MLAFIDMLNKSLMHSFIRYTVYNDLEEYKKRSVEIQKVDIEKDKFRTIQIYDMTNQSLDNIQDRMKQTIKRIFSKEKK